jgi:hypothetical protein
MSLRKSPELTPKLLAAARQNAQHSTGPRSPAAKQNSKMNALKHGQRASPENHHQVMLALGEDPQEFEDLKQELITAYGPGDALWEKQIDDLARLYWRRERLERAQEGLMRRALLGVEEWQHRRQQEMAGATFDASQPEAIDLDMTEPADPGVRLRMLLSFLGVIRAQVKQRTFKQRQASEIGCLYQNQEGWRQARLLSLLRLFNRSVKPRTKEDVELEESLSKEFGPREQAGEAQYQELLRLLDEEIAHVQEEFQYAEKVNEEKAAIERDAALAPVGEDWRTMVRQQGALDRSIDRKVRILLAMRKEFPTGAFPSIAPDEDNDPNTAHIDKTVGTDIPSENQQSAGRMENTKMNERRGNLLENKGSEWKMREGDGNVDENKGTYSSEAGMLLKRKGVSGGWRRKGRSQVPGVRCQGREEQASSARFRVSGARRAGCRCQVSGVRGQKGRLQVPGFGCQGLGLGTRD